MPDHMLTPSARSLALLIGLGLAGLPGVSGAQDPKPKPASGPASPAPPKRPADADDPATARPGDKVMKVQTESEKLENEKEKAKPAAGGSQTKPASSP